MEASAPDPLRDLVDYGHGGVIVDFESYPDLSEATAQRWLLAPDGPQLQGPQVRLR